MAEPPAASFAGLLRRLRTNAGLTQEELAQATGLSVRSISDLERGINLTARKATARLLADALGLAGPPRAEFEAAARGRAQGGGLGEPAGPGRGLGGLGEPTDSGRGLGGPGGPGGGVGGPGGGVGGPGGGVAAPGMRSGAVAAATRTLPRDIASFTGRQSELSRLIRAADAAEAAHAGDAAHAGNAAHAGDVGDAGGSGGVVEIHAIGGMAGVGKTAFAVHAAHQLAPRFPDGQIFLPLHAHTRGQRPVDPADALASLLQTAGVAAQQIPPGLEARMGLWRDHLAGKRLLLLLDDAAGHEQIRPLLPGTAGSLVLVTSRRHLTALEDAHAVSLDTLPAQEAALLLIRLAARPGLDPADAAVGQITRLCGYLPLAVGMLARQLHHHPAWSAADLADDLAAARDRLALMHAENLSVAAALDLSYQDLSADQQRLFRHLSLHPGTDIDGYAAAALDDTDLPAARRRLDALYDQYLLAEPARGRYRMHDLIREHARALAAIDPAADRQAALDRLLDYYEYAATTAGSYFASRPARVPTVRDPRPAAPELTTRDQAARWLEAERVNLHDCIAAAASGSRPARAVSLAAAIGDFLASAGHWDQALAVGQAALAAARLTGDRKGAADALARLGHLQYMLDEYDAAARTLADALNLHRELGDRQGLADALTQLGDVQRMTGDSAAAIGTLTDALEVYRDLDDRQGQARALTYVGGIQTGTSDYAAASSALTTALALYSDLKDRRGQARALNYLSAGEYLTGHYADATQTVTQVLELYRDLGDRFGEAHALMNLGGIQTATSSYVPAAQTLTRALELYRDRGDRLGQANALLYLSSVYAATGQYAAATGNLSQARALYRDIRELHGEANVLTVLGDVQHRTGDYAAAASTLGQALAFFRELGIRLGEADVLAILGDVQHRTGDYAAAAGTLDQALASYREIGDRRGEADALNRLGALTLAASGPADAVQRYSQALRLARLVHGQMEEARALEGLGRCLIEAGDGRKGADHLRQALEIYQRIGVPEAQRVATTLRDHDL